MINKRLISIVEEYNPLNKRLDSDMSLYHDLNIFGDDADELLMQISKEFNISMSNFIFSEYFPNEGESLTSAIFNFIKRVKKPTFKKLTINKLQKAIETRELR